MKKKEIIKILKLLKDNIEIIQKKITTDNINKNKVNFCISKLDIIQENLNN